MTTDDDRLKEAVAFKRDVKLSEARERVCEAAVEWHRCHHNSDTTAILIAEDELMEASERLAELEDQCNSEA
jgi:hypothetical protein